MKLGKDTGSLVNYMYGGKQDTNPEIGMGCTILMWSDRHAATIIGIKNKIIKVQRDIATRTDKNGMSESQDYDYQEDPNGSIYFFKQDKDGSFREVRENIMTGRYNYANGTRLLVGIREEYYDFSF